MENEILDLEVSKTKFERFRPLAIILELAPLLVGLLGLAIGSPQMITIGFLTASLLYVLLSWYYFKAMKYTIWSILASSFFGIGLSVIIIGFTFYFQSWEGFDHMVLIGHLTLILCLVLSFCYMVLMSWVLGDK